MKLLSFTEFDFEQVALEHMMNQTSNQKRIRIIEADVPGIKSGSNRQQTFLYEKVICQRDYLSFILHFFRIKETIQLIARLSKFHYQFINHSNQSKLINKCISYDFGDVFSKLLEFKLVYSNDNATSICKQIYDIYNDWNVVTRLATESRNVNLSQATFASIRSSRDNQLKQDFNIQLLLIAQNFQFLKYWLYQVKYCNIYNKHETCVLYK